MLQKAFPFKIQTIQTDNGTEFTYKYISDTEKCPFDIALEAAGIHFDRVVSIEIEDAVIEARMTGRRVCGSCGASFHLTAHPPKVEGVCDVCGKELIVRKDDKPETVRHRLEVYHASTEVLKDFYGKLGRLRTVNGNQSIEGANEDILKAIGAKV